jgi:hypothetical protein
MQRNIDIRSKQTKYKLMIEAAFFETIDGREAVVEPTGMYLRRVSNKRQPRSFYIYVKPRGIGP